MNNFKEICDKIINENLSGKFITRNGNVYNVNSLTVNYTTCTGEDASIAESYPIYIDTLGIYTENGSVYTHIVSDFDIVTFIPDDNKNNEELIDKFETWLYNNFSDKLDEWDKIDGVSCVFDSFKEMFDNFYKTFKIEKI